MLSGTGTGASVKEDHEEITILAVDDEPDVVELTAELLEREDERFTVVTETSARDGIERLAAADIDCVVSDYDMPRMNGLKFLRRVREEDSTLPFILFTGKGSEEIASEAISAGVTDYLQKGSGTERYELLANRINTAVSQYRTESQLERQNELFAKAQDIAKVGAWEYNPQAEEAYFSDEVYDIYGVGHDHEPSPEKDIQRFYHPEDRERVREAVRRALEFGEGYDIEVRLTAADGTDKWVRTRADPYLADGEVVKVRGTIRDITDRKEREQQLKQTQQRFRTLYEQLSQPVVEVEFDDRDPIVVDVNPAFEEIFGYDRDTITGESLDAYLVPEDRQAEAREINKDIIDGRQPTSKEITRQTATGSREFLLETALYDDSTGGFGIYTDITDRKEQEHQLERKNARLSALFEHFPEPTLAYAYDDGEPYIRYVNEAFTETFGVEAAEAVGEHVDRLVVPPDRQEQAREIDERVRAGETLDEELRRQAHDGLRDFLFRNIRLPEDDEIDGYAIYTDITDAKERERELEREREFIEKSLDTLDDIFYLVDTNGDFERWNSTLPERTGYSNDEISSMNSLEFFEGEHREAIQTSIRNILETGSHVTEAEITTADGRAIPHEFRGVRMTDDDGNPTGIIGIARDITERKQREERLIRQNEQLEEFVGVVSHDLRNPLNVAELRLELAAEECDSEHLSGAADAIARSQALIEDLLRLAREDEEVTEIEPLELADVAEHSWETVETGSAKLSLDTTQAIHADRSRLQQLFENLYRNAVEHGGEGVTVNVGDTDSGFYVADTGPGIPESDRDEIFEARYSTADDGTGFGLRIVEQITEAHGWGIRVGDSADGGARFDITGVEMVD